MRNKIKNRFPSDRRGNFAMDPTPIHGRLDAIVTLGQGGAIVPAISRETFDEFRAVLAYPKFTLTEGEIGAIMEDEILPPAPCS
jgi:hypothetical protein